MSILQYQKPHKTEEKMEQEFVIEALTQENALLKNKLALQTMEASDEDKQYAEKLFKEMQDELAILCIEVNAVKKSRDEFQSENQKLKRRIAVLEKKLKG